MASAIRRVIRGSRAGGIGGEKSSCSRWRDIHPGSIISTWAECVSPSLFPLASLIGSEVGVMQIAQHSGYVEAKPDSVDHMPADLLGERCHPSHHDCGFDAWVECGQQIAAIAANGETDAAETLGIDLGTLCQVVNGSYVV